MSTRENICLIARTSFLFFHSLVAVLTLYLVAGVVFNVAYKKQSGRDLIPNVQFWASLPGLIKVSTCADPEGNRGPKPQLENHNNIGFISNTGPGRERETESYKSHYFFLNPIMIV